MTLKTFSESLTGLVSNLRKGDRVLACGVVENREYNGKQYTDMLLDFLLTSDAAPVSAAQSANRSALESRMEASGFDPDRRGGWLAAVSKGVPAMQTTPLPEAPYLTYEARFMDPSAPEGLWLVPAPRTWPPSRSNAACLALGAPADALRRSKAFLETFSFVLVVGADPWHVRVQAADALRRQVPAVEVCVTAQSAYRGCTSVRELRDTCGLEAVNSLWEDAEEMPPYGLLEIFRRGAGGYQCHPPYPTGIPALDQLIGGYDGEVTVWTGKRKEGKSTIVGLVILSVIRAGRKVLVYSGELPAWRYKQWLLSMAAGPDYVAEGATDTGKTVWDVRPEIARQIDLWWKDQLFWWITPPGTSISRKSCWT